MTTVRILALDGGGMKGLFSATFMNRFCQDAGINPTEIGQYFNIIAGSSIGAIMGAAYGVGQTPAQVSTFFTTYGSQIFQYTAPIIGTKYSPMPVAIKGTYFGGLTTFNTTGSFYGDNAPNTPTLGPYGTETNAVLAGQLQATIGADLKMFQFKTNMLFTSVERIPIQDDQEVNFNYRPVVFSNVNIPGFLEGQNYLAWQCVMASGSAPLYLPPTQITGSPANVRYIDGGVYQNNPANLALTVANILYPGATRICILSVGCGLGTVGFFDPTSSTEPRLGVSDNLEYLTQVIDIAGTGNQEAVAKYIQLGSLYGNIINGANLFSYRFQTTFDPTQNTELDNSSPAFLQYMQDAANAQYDLDALKIQLFIQKLQTVS